MRYISEYRSGSEVASLLEQIRSNVEPKSTYRLMEFCGGHTHALFRFGLVDLLPKQIKLIHGPGCPVCVLPISRIDTAIAIAEKPNTILCSYGDMLRVPGSNQNSLLRAKARGADVRMVYSPQDAITIANSEADKTVVFFAVGFETTTPPTAALIDQCIKQGVTNLKIFCNHLLTPPAINSVLAQNQADPEFALDGIIGPGHVSLITGMDVYTTIVEQCRVPIVISGFEPTDMLQSILQLIKQINANVCALENQYSRAVTPKGNEIAQSLMEKYFAVREQFEWRGLGALDSSALKIRSAFAQLDAEHIYDDVQRQAKPYKACECPAVLTGRKSPLDCPLFDKPCTPDNPLGSCMVSSEGACSAYYQYNNRAQHSRNITES